MQDTDHFSPDGLLGLVARLIMETAAAEKIPAVAFYYLTKNHLSLDHGHHE